MRTEGVGAFGRSKVLLLSPPIGHTLDGGLQQMLLRITLDQLEPPAGLAEVSQL